MLKAEDILASYYQRVWNGLLPSLNFKDLRCWSQRGETLATIDLSDQQRALIDRKIQHYRSKLAPMNRFTRVVDYLPTNWASEHIVDIGAGAGFFGDYVTGLLEAKGQFTSLEPKQHDFKVGKHARIFRWGQMMELPPTIAFFGFSLHHMTNSAVVTYLSELRDVKCKHIIVLEDTFDRLLQGYKVKETLSTQFINLCDKDKFEVFRINDYISNVWMYGGNPDSAISTHRCTKSWADEFSNYGYSLFGQSLQGFDYHRIHGVPSALMAFKLDSS